MFGRNQILVILRSDYGPSPGHENVWPWFLNRHYYRALSRKLQLAKTTNYNL